MPANCGIVAGANPPRRGVSFGGAGANSVGGRGEMSAGQISFGFVAANFRSTEFAATGESWSESVVLTRNFLCEIA